MSSRKKVLASSIGILFVACLIVLALAIKLLYGAAFTQERQRLVDVVRSQARILEAVAQFDREHLVGGPQESQDAALRQVRDAYSRHITFGRTGEVFFARREGDSMIFLLRHFGPDIDKPEPIPLSHHAAEPMSRALRGESGWMIGPDYRGVMVLAAYEPVEGFDIGIVAKTDLSEIREPFFRAGLYAGSVALLIIAAGSLLIFFVSNPIIQEVEESKARLQLLMDSVPALISYIGSDHRYQFNNKAYEEWFGRSRSEIHGKHVREVIGEEAFTALRDYFDAAFSGKRVSYERLSPYKEGGSRYIQGNYIPHTDEQGHVKGIVVLVNDLTQHKSAEEALKRSESLLRRVMDSMPLGVWIVDEAGNLNRGNPAGQQIWAGRRYIGVDQFGPYKARRLDTENSSEPCEGAVIRAVRHGETTLNEELEIECFDGTRRIILNSAVPVFDENKKILAAIVINQDITRRKRMEEELRQSYDELEQRVRERTAELTLANEALEHQREVLQTIIDNIPVMLCFYDPTGKVELASRELERLLGWSLEDIRREDFDIMEECYPNPEYRKMVWDYMMEAAPGWRDFSMRTRLGQSLESSWANVRLSDGSQIGIGLDVTQRKHAEQALRESEERFRLITETIHDVFWMSTPGAGKIIYVSPAYERLWGRTRESLYADPQSFIEAVHPEDKLRVLSQIAEHAQDKWECQYRIIRPEGNVRWIQDRGFPIRDDQGKLLFMTGVANDITDRKRAEEELSLYMKKLHESNQALQDFASIASHDLQEPLRKVISFGNMLKQKYNDSLGEDGKDYLSRMLNATERMQSLLKSLLDYSRVTSRAEPFRPVELSTLIREVLSDLEVRIESSGGSVELGELPTIEADPTQMHQLFQNLIGNALKFHKKDEKPVVKVHCTARRTGFYEITVEDNGIGFDEKYLDRIFAPFQRLHGKSSYEGTGMGLTICKKIVERHGGNITAKSAPGKGAMFIVTLAEPMNAQASFSFPSTEGGRED